MKKQILVTLSFLVFIFACQNEPKTDQSHLSKPDVVLPELTAKLICQSTNDTNDEIPKSEVFLQLGDYKLKIGYLLNCAEIDTANYSNYQIPQNALTAAGGWWAGAGDYFYVIKNGENFVVKKGIMNAQKAADDYGYKTISTFSKNGQPIYSKQELTGIYILGSHDESYIFSLGLDGNKNWDAILYEIDGMLPPQAEIERYFADFKMIELNNFVVNMADLSFDSDLGKGQIELNTDFQNITFFDKAWLGTDIFEMKKIK